MTEEKESLIRGSGRLKGDSCHPSPGASCLLATTCSPFPLQYTITVVVIVFIIHARRGRERATVLVPNELLRRILAWSRTTEENTHRSHKRGPKEMLLPPTSNVYRVISENLQLKFYVDASDGENLHLSQ